MAITEVADPPAEGPAAADQSNSAPAEKREPLRRLGLAPDATSKLELVRIACAILALLLLGFLVTVVGLSRLHYKAAQQIGFDKFRNELALGTAPTGQTTSLRFLLPLGTPVALLDIPSIGIHDMVVSNGTTSSVLMGGPGHRRDTPLPGQRGGIPSYILGRAAAYGGPFGRIHELKRGARITVTTGEGVSRFRVTDVRHPGQPEPPLLKANQARLTLETASGRGFFPSGVVLVDATSVSRPLAPSPTVIPLGSLPAHEAAMATDDSMLWALVLWLAALVLLAGAAVWSWIRWGRPQTWIVFVPLLLVVDYFLSGQVVRLLPNLT